MSKEFKMGFIEEVEPLKLTTIPKKYQKLIEATENRWFNKMQKLAKIYQKRIDDLEHRLSNCIEPKFKVGQEVWHCYRNCKECDKTIIDFISVEITENFVNFTYCDIEGFVYYETMLFATEEEARVKLEEMNNG